MANISLFPADTGAEQQPIALGQKFEQLGVGHAEPGTGANTGVEHQSIEVALAKGPAGELGKGGKLAPQILFNG